MMVREGKIKEGEYLRKRGKRGEKEIAKPIAR